MQQPSVQTIPPTPTASSITTSGNNKSASPRRGLVSLIFLLVMVVIVGTCLYWLQWSAAQGIATGYIQPTVDIKAPKMTFTRGEISKFAADSKGRDLTYSWQFTQLNNFTPDQNTTSDEKIPSYTFTEIGSYTIYVRVSDPTGQIATDNITVEVLPQKPTAGFTFTIDDSSFWYAGSARFDASSSSADTDAQIEKYFWDFGDSNSDVSYYYSSTSHGYDEPGTYTVTLIVTDNYGQESEPYTQQVTIKDTSRT